MTGAQDASQRQSTSTAKTSTTVTPISKPEITHFHLVNLLTGKPVRVAIVAVANKMARIVWAIMTRGDVYQPDHVSVLSAWRVEQSLVEGSASRVCRRDAQ